MNVQIEIVQFKTIEEILVQTEKMKSNLLKQFPWVNRWYQQFVKNFDVFENQLLKM